MADNMRVFLITLSELMTASPSVKLAMLNPESKVELDEASGQWLIRHKYTPLEITARVIRNARDSIRSADNNIKNEKARNLHKSIAYSDLDGVRGALFFEWEYSESGPAPGVVHTPCILHSGLVHDYLQDMSQGLPEPIKKRFSTYPNFGYGADFPPDLAADSPIRASNLSGCWVFYRKEIEALKQGYEGIDKDYLFSPYIQSAWNLLFRDHD